MTGISDRSGKNTTALTAESRAVMKAVRTRSLYNETEVVPKLSSNKISAAIVRKSHGGAGT